MNQSHTLGDDPQGPQAIASSFVSYGRHYYFAAITLPLEAFGFILSVQVIFENEDGFIALYVECSSKPGYPKYQDLMDDFVEGKLYTVQRFASEGLNEKLSVSDSESKVLLVEKRMTRLGLEIAFNF